MENLISSTSITSLYAYFIVKNPQNMMLISVVAEVVERSK